MLTLTDRHLTLVDNKHQRLVVYDLADALSMEVVENDQVSINVFPNPFNDFTNLMITVEKPCVAGIIINDGSGRVIKIGENFLTG